MPRGKKELASFVGAGHYGVSRVFSWSLSVNHALVWALVLSAPDAVICPSGMISQRLNHPAGSRDSSMEWTSVPLSIAGEDLYGSAVVQCLVQNSRAQMR